MWQYLLIFIIWIGFILHWSIGSIPQKKYFEIYAGSGIGICLTLLILGLSGWFHTQINTELGKLLKTIGSILYIVAIIIAAISLATLQSKGKPNSGIENTTIFIKQGIFKVIRHPLYLGLAFWSIGLVLLIQSFPSVILGILALVSYFMAAKMEDKFNISKFGNSYEEYVKNVPIWNFIKGLDLFFQKDRH